MREPVAIIVLAIAVLAVIVSLWTFSPVSDREYLPAAQAQINALVTALEVYKQATGSYPTTAQGLPALRTQPLGVRNWLGPYIPKNIPLDPWGRPWQYLYPGPHGDRPDIWSCGADGKPGGIGVNADWTSWALER